MICLKGKSSRVLKIFGISMMFLRKIFVQTLFSPYMKNLIEKMKLHKTFIFLFLFKVEKSFLFGGGDKLRGKSNKSSELAELTTSVVLSILFFTSVFWIFPVIPIVIVLMCGLTFTAFLSLWLIGLPFTGLAFYYIFKTRR